MFTKILALLLLVAPALGSNFTVTTSVTSSDCAFAYADQIRYALAEQGLIAPEANMEGSLSLPDGEVYTTTLAYSYVAMRKLRGGEKRKLSPAICISCQSGGMTSLICSYYHNYCVSIGLGRRAAEVAERETTERMESVLVLKGSAPTYWSSGASKAQLDAACAAAQTSIQSQFAKKCKSETITVGHGPPPS